ncbi:HAD-IIA family hydrolase [Saccharothrix sp. S26]|uniref:HAD-IIA family hydrolase n=1 Tax=Saccharothrix sp. S26 TaxID=2907215 RepID=UPI001F32AE01|nr:HAD-IIA family hydrolase [Saccharothrix sp. S26]MCE6998248.1 HAD-IIA family hydrolase [Saccharothrix sp. S26]
MAVLADGFDGFIVDLDGVVHVGGRPLPGAVETLSALARDGKGIVYLTNDPRHARATVAARLTSWGLPTRPAAVVTSGWFAAAEVAAGGARVFVIGTDELRAEAAEAGAVVLTADEAEHADRILVSGHDGFDYAELRAACRAGARGAELFATNRDATFPMPDGLWPGTGAVLAAVETALGRRATALGKPEPAIFRTARALLGGGRVAVVGDRVETDVEGGRRAGLPTVLVRPDPLPEDAHPRPDHVVGDLTGLLAPA